MASNTSNIIQYLAACYREENARAGIWDIYGSSVENPTFLDGEEHLAQGYVESVHMIPSSAEVLANKAEQFRREKSLVYAGLFLVGQAAPPWSENPMTICAPLVTYPASVDAKSSQLEIDLQGRRFNSPVLDHLSESDPDTSITDALEDAVGAQTLSPNSVLLLTSVLEKAIPGMAMDPTANFPILADTTAIKQAIEKAKHETGWFTIIPAFCAALVKNPTASRGVLDELRELGESDSFSAPIQKLLSDRKVSISKTNLYLDEEFDHVPVIPSEPQKAILSSARHNPLTLAVGPPGTGKSFTIAAIAIEHISRGESVLIATRMDHAVDVVADKISDIIGEDDAVVRAGKSQYLRQLKKYLDELLSGMHSADQPDDIKRLSRQIRKLNGWVDSFRQKFERNTTRSLDWGERLAQKPSGWFGWLQRFRQSLILDRVNRATPLAALLLSLEHHLDQLADTAKTYLRAKRKLRIRQLLKNAREDLKSFRKAIGSKTSSSQAERFSKLSLENILSAFPIWLANLSDIHRALPFNREMFDVAIIDESSQCDIASALPILQRAKRAVIAGDPKQLRHISFLSRRRLASIASTHSISAEAAETFNYRNKSLLDAFASKIESQSQIGFLNEHYRSQPPIIDFSNNQFYSGKLHILTRRRATTSSPPLTLTYCPDGVRLKAGHNPVEAEALVQRVYQIVKGELELPAKDVHSIGILSPFRAQVDYLHDRIASRLGDYASRAYTVHDLRVGTAHTFQGEERDIMFISLAVDAQSVSATYRFLQQEDVFNVAITRARQNQHVFTSLAPADRPTSGLLADYLAHITEVESGRYSTSTLPTGDKPRDEFVREVIEALGEREVSCVAGYGMGNLSLDLLATKDERLLGIDLVGFTGSSGPALPLERCLMFHRAGLRLFPLSYARWLADRKGSINALMNALDYEVNTND